MPTDAIHQFLDIVTPIILAVVAYVTIMNRLERAKSEASIMKSQNSLKENFNEKHAENKQDLAVHVAEDRGQFASITVTLDRMVRNLEKLANGGKVK